MVGTSRSRARGELSICASWARTDAARRARSAHPLDVAEVPPSLYSRRSSNERDRAHDIDDRPTAVSRSRQTCRELLVELAIRRTRDLPRHLADALGSERAQPEASPH